MAQETLYPGEFIEVTVPTGQKLAISVYSGQAIVFYRTVPSNTPQQWYEHARVTNSSAIYGTFATDQDIRIEAADSTVKYEVATTPTGETINSPDGTEIVINDDGNDVNTRIESATNANAFIVDGATGDIIIGEANRKAWSSGYEDIYIGGNASIIATSGIATGSYLYMLQNAYYNAGWKYISDGYGTYYQQTSGAHTFFISQASGLADGAITWSIPLNLGLADITVNSQNLDTNFTIKSLIGSAAFYVDGATGNIGLNNSNIESWATGYTGFQIGGNTSIMSATATGSNLFELFHNAFFDGAAYRYMDDGVATSYSQSSGAHLFRTVASGTAENTITWIDQLQLKLTEAVFNEGGADIDHRIESDTNTNALFIEGSTSNLGVNTTSFADGAGVVGVLNATTAPTTNPTNGHIIYVDPADGGLKSRGAGGTVTVLAAT